jgi:hypothetical protein
VRYFLNFLGREARNHEGRDIPSGESHVVEIQEVSCICTAGIRALALGMPSAALRPIPPRLEERRAMRRCGRRRLFSSSGYFTMLSYPWEPLSFSTRQFERPPSGRSVWFLYRTPPFGLYWLSNSKILSSMRYLLDVNQSLYFSTAGRQRAQSLAPL